MASNSGVMSPSPRVSSPAYAVDGRGVDDREVQLLVAGAERSNRSKTWSMTQSGRAPGLSILLMTTMGRSPCSKALLVTKRVCGIGPVLTASTSSSTESTMDSTRSTSPPKSACPGVSTMLMR
jgi:hypothetical protein